TSQIHIDTARISVLDLSGIPTPEIAGQNWFLAIIADTSALFVIPPLPDDENCDSADYGAVIEAEQEAIDAADQAIFAAAVLVGDAISAENDFLAETRALIQATLTYEHAAVEAIQTAYQILGPAANPLDVVPQLFAEIDQLTAAIEGVEDADDPDT